MGRHINFCHIAPTSLVEEAAQRSDAHLILAHLVRDDPTYCAKWQQISDGKLRIMDNSMFELFQQGREMFPPDELVDLAYRVSADVIVLPDKPYAHVSETIELANKYRDRFRNLGFQTMFVPQSEFGQWRQYLTGVEHGLEAGDMVGISILGAPVALGVAHDALWLRYIARRRMFELMEMNTIGLLERARNQKRQPFHCLGMTDGPYEVRLLRDWADVIYSWDSSTACWNGYHHKHFRFGSPTGLVEGKEPSHVDFDAVFDDTGRQIAHKNMGTINAQIRLNSIGQ